MLLSTGNVTVNETTASSTATFNVSTQTQTIGALTFGGAGATSTSINAVSIGSGGTLTLGGTVTSDATNNPLGTFVTGGTLDLGATRTFDIGDSSSVTNDFTISSVISGAGFGLIKTGVGRLVLSGANTYTGGTTVNSGTVSVINTTGSGVGTGAVTVNSGTTILGSGFIGGTTTIASGGRIRPGNTFGTLTFTNGLTLDAGSILNFDLGTTSDLIRVSGGTLAGPSSGLITLDLIDAGGFATGSYTLFDFSGATTSSFDVADLTLGSLVSGTQSSDYTLSISGSTLIVTYTASAIPEPSAYAFFAGLMALFAVLARRRGVGVRRKVVR